jgi:hypothetical protein
MACKITTIAFYGQIANGIIAVLGAAAMIEFSYANPPRAASLLAPAAGAIAIFTAGAILTGIALLKLKNVVASCDVKRLIDDADLRNSRYDEPTTAERDSVFATLMAHMAPLGALLVAVCSVIALFLLGLAGRPASSLWSTMIGILAGEAIFLASMFEHVAMKSELESLASSWAKMQGPDARMSSAWASRTVELHAALAALDRDRDDARSSTTTGAIQATQEDASG